MFFKNIVRLAIVERCDYKRQTVTIRMMDSVSDKTYKCPLYNPLAMKGSGIYAAITPGTIVAVASTYNEAPVIVGTVSQAAYAQDLTKSINTGNFLYSESRYPDLQQGELAIQGLTGSKLLFDKKGNVRVSHGLSETIYSNSDIISTKAISHYELSSARRVVSGPIKRDQRKVQPRVSKIVDKLFDPSFDDSLAIIGRNPDLKAAKLTGGQKDTEITRNPALVENRVVIFEYDREANVRGFDKEINLLGGDPNFSLTAPNRRDQVRADVLNLNPLTVNNLIEKIEGTVVDRYGNILDLNRNKISFAGVDPKGGSDRALREDFLLRRSIKYHFEINSRKEPIQEIRPDILDSRAFDGISIDNGHVHSRWSVDVDAEGLTKINIPASSDTGNIPLLTRYVNSSMVEGNQDWSYRDDSQTDVLHLAFGELSEDRGIDIDSADYAPKSVVAEGQPGAGQSIKYRTAWHDLPSTASQTFSIGDGATQTKISNRYDDPYRNAGGRSLHANLDGSLELNIGRDSADGKSVVVDTSGSAIYRIGKDPVSENSLVAQLDGHIKVQVGGDSIEADAKTQNPSVKFFVEAGGNYHEIEINEVGVFIRSAPGKNLVLESGNNLVLTSVNQTLLHGDVVSIYGDHDGTGNGISGERLIQRSGKMVS